jgi:hypothetical protein
MNRNGRIGVVAASVAIVAVAAILAVAAIATGWTPAVPAEGALPLIARTVLTGEITPDVTEGVDPETLPRSPYGQECLDRIERQAGPLDLCWEAYRDPHDGDPLQDSYLLRVYGTFGGESGTGVRWASVRARLVGGPSNNVFSAWPDDTFEEACREVAVSLGGIVRTLQPEWLCGRTTGRTNTEDWSHRVTWTCVGCLVPGHESRGIVLYNFVAVPAGSVPAWEIQADLGG